MSTGESIRVRTARAGDGARVSEIYHPYVVETPITFEESPPDAAEMESRLAAIGAQYPYLIAEAGGEVAGYAYACPHRARASYRWAVDVAVYVERGLRRRGLGRALYGALLPIVQRQGYVMAYAGITVPNAASAGLHEAMGFRHVVTFRNEGYKLGQWRDVGWWEMPLNAPTVPPPEPVPWPAVRQEFFP